MKDLKISLMLRYVCVVSCIVWMMSCDFSDKKGDDAKAILQSPPFAALTDSIRQSPDNPRLYSQRALLLSQHDHHELATTDYRKAWELNPVEPIAMQYVNNLLLVDKPQEAIDFLKECIATWPDNTDLHRRLSEIYEQTGQTQRAVRQYDELLQQDSLNFEAWYNKGILLSRLRDTAGAIDALERSYAAQPIYYNGITLAGFYATTVNPRTPALCDELIAKDVTNELPDAHFVKGLYYSYDKQYDSAMVQFNECIRRDWRFADAHVEKGIILFEQKKLEQALETFVTAATVGNTNADAYYWMGRCYEEAGNKQLARLNYERALAIDRDYDAAREGISRLKG